MTAEELAEQLQRVIALGREGGLSDEAIIAALEDAIDGIEEDLPKPQAVGDEGRPR